MTLFEYENLSKSEHYKQNILRQKFETQIAEHTDISAFSKIKVNNIYFEATDTGYKMRPIYRDDEGRQEWQDIQVSFEEEEARDTLIHILERLTCIDKPVRDNNNDVSDDNIIFSNIFDDSTEKGTNVSDIINSDTLEEKISAVRVADKEYLNQCHNYVFDVQAAAYLMKVGLYLYIDKLQVGYDTKTKEIILPLDGVKGSRYFSIRLEFDHAADEEEAQKVLQYYNLKPNETAKWNLYKDADGKLINDGKNYDEPYNELGKKLIEKLQNGDDEKYASSI